MMARFWHGNFREIENLEGKKEGFWEIGSDSNCVLRVDRSPCWARTSDPMINSHLLYRLS